MEITKPSPSGLVTPAATPTRMRHIPSLDGIRAISFMAVFLSHAGPRHMLIPGNFGVTTFFFLSGFLITTLMRSEFEKNGVINVQHFYLRRALRILPPFYLVLLAAVLTAVVLYPPGTLYGPTLAAQALFVANYEGIWGVNREIPGTGVVWSLAVEEHFYLLFPWLYIAMQKWHLPRSGQAWLLWGLCAVTLLWRCVLVLAMHRSGARIYIASDTRMDSILFGCALAVWNNPALDAPTGPVRLWTYILIPAALITLGVSFAYQGEVLTQTLGLSIQGVALTVLFIAAVRFHAWLPFRWLNLRPVAFVGVLSYSLYLVHQIILHAVAWLGPQWPAVSRAAITLAASMIVAWVIYSVVERPCARLRKRLMDR